MLKLFMILLVGALLGEVVYRYARNKISCTNRLLVLCNMGLWFCIYIIEGIRLESVLYMLVSTVLLTVSVIDWITLEIPLECNVVLGILGLLHLLTDHQNWMMYVIGAGTVSGIFLVIYFATKGQGIGGGDIKLMISAGLLLGWQKVLLALFIGSVLGTVIHLSLMRFCHKDRILAFGPYLAAGILLAGLWGDELIQWYLSFFA